MKANFQSIVNGPTPVLVDFYANWCQPCKMQAPILQEVAREMGDKLKVIKIDVDKNPDIARQLQIQGVPTLALFKQGDMLWRQSGVMQKQALISIIQQHI